MSAFGARQRAALLLPPQPGKVQDPLNRAWHSGGRSRRGMVARPQRGRGGQPGSPGKMFSVQLNLGEQTWESEGSSIKKAQQAVANKALTESTLPKPVQKPPKSNVNNNPGSITPTVELNGLAMKRGEPAIYRPLDPKPFPNYRANYNFRGMYNQRYHCPMPKIFYVQLTVGNNEFFGEGKTRQAARHNAAMKALQALQNEPIPEKSSQNGESGKEMDDDKDANKSEISLVFEIALKRNMPVSFEVIKESGPPHMKSFVTRVSVGEFSAEGEGNSKKLSKKRAATTVLQELKKLPPLPVVEKPKLFFKKRPKTIVKAGPEYGQGMNPISRLAQIQQAKKEKEPDYVLLSERGMPRRREFVMQVKVGSEVATGTGPNKKIAKKNAAEAMLLQLGFKASTSLQDQLEKVRGSSSQIQSLSNRGEGGQGGLGGAGILQALARLGGRRWWQGRTPCAQRSGQPSVLHRESCQVGVFWSKNSWWGLGIPEGTALKEIVDVGKEDESCCPRAST
ncbi:double-stranded RNA-binding protein Staufen homolog 2-like [Carlito syrichta]|uniref:Double-stranded RNA-binding protein Staufen homolog 2-like n=1 Tax=Carlito syrichta TaxID=1868482 RepID=A0A3Q0DSB9_CARSF|nr:double-stranded RNA-binding protein Staufen homolog 2-like [Carlito syrichta]